MRASMGACAFVCVLYNYKEPQFMKRVADNRCSKEPYPLYIKVYINYIKTVYRCVVL